MLLEKLKKMFHLTGFKVGLCLTIVSLFIYLVGVPFLDVMELKAYDLHFLTRGKVQPGDEVVIAAIDQKSIDSLGRWPWPRYRMAELIESLNGYEAKVVAFDAVFSEPDESSGVRVMRDFKERFADLEIKAAFEAAEVEADNDARFSQVLKSSPSVVMGYFFFTSNAEIAHLKEKSSKFSEYTIPSRYSSIRYLDPGAPLPPFPEAAAVERNIPILTEAASDFGYFNILPDSDGTVRWVPLAIQYGQDVYTHLSVEAVRKYFDSAPVVMNIADYGVDSIRIGPREIHSDERGRLLINFRGPSKTFPHYSISDIIEKKVPAEALKDKIVLVGATAIGVYDMRVTPFSGTFPGIEIHANVIDNILQGDWISRPDWIVLFDVAAILIFGLGLAYLIARIGALYAALVTVGLIGIYLVGNNYVFSMWRIWLSEVYPVFAMVFVSGGVVTFRFMTEEKKKREIKEAFGRYVAPSLVNNILKDPSKLVLGGEERRLTVFFSDIRGFTTISEGLEPQVLVKLINDYLTPMTDIVLKNGGTVDKYMGDAIMAFWGAPVWQEDHPIRAARTSLEMMQKLKNLQKEWAEKGLPSIDIGIGLSTGNLTVGNMGSSLRFDYTVMGDSVNLGSRLEGLNKEYGTHIIVPKFTFEDIKHEFTLRELDLIRVKGKKVPIRIFELMGEKGDLKLREIADSFEKGLASYRSKDWTSAEKYLRGTIALNPGDGPSRAFLARIETLRAADLPEDWDGVYTMTKK